MADALRAIAHATSKRSRRFLRGYGTESEAPLPVPIQPAASKRFASTFLRTLAGSQMRPFMAM